MIGPAHKVGLFAFSGRVVLFLDACSGLNRKAAFIASIHASLVRRDEQA
jgi:hypothetical protein